MTRIPLIAVFLSGCMCDSNIIDAGTDSGSSIDAGARQDAGVLFELPPVDAGEDCTGVTRDAGIACVPASWFYLPRWSTSLTNDNGQPVVSAKQSAVYLDRFFVMRHEVTHREWYAYVLDAGLPSIPELCGCNDVFTSPEGVETEVPEYSGWQPDGGPWDANLNRPVACITREEAHAFCAAQGGRLPTIIEYLRLARGEAPSQRPYPWGNTPPVFNNPTHFKDSLQGYIEVGPNAPDIGTRSRGVNEYDVYELADGVSEFTWECVNALEPDVWSDAGIVIRPERTADVTRCAGAPAVVGENFLLLPSPQQCCSINSYSMPPNEHILFETATGAYPPIAAQFGRPRCTTNHPDVRLRTVGFRCAFDRPPQ